MKFNIGDRVRLKIQPHDNAYLKEGAIGTVCDLGPFGVSFDDYFPSGHNCNGNNCEYGHGWFCDDALFELVGPKNMQDLSANQEKLLDKDTKTLRRAYFLDSTLELTSEGRRALEAIMFDQNKKALVAAANEAIARKQKEEDEE